VSDRSSTALRFGSAFHKGLETLCTHADPIEADSLAQADIRANYAELPAWAVGNDEAENDWQVECETVATLAWSYARHWAAAGQSLSSLETVATELPFELPIVNPETGSPSPLFQFAGKIDRIVKMPDGRMAVLETKTTSESLDADSDYWRRLRIDTQISGYIVAAQVVGYPVETVIYDVVKKPGIKPKLVKGVRETPDQYANRLREDIAERPAFYFARREVARLRSDISEFLQELWDETQILRFHQRTERWPRNSAACVHPYPCEYRDLCFNSVNPLDSGVPSGFRFSETAHPELQEQRT
jgi:RecB family exonuclease